jgi:hypothetical protein
VLKKALLFSTLLIGTALSSLTYAGGPDNMAPPVASPPPAAKVRGIYVDAGAGFAITNWADGIENLFPSVFSELVRQDNKKGGFVYGGDLGYQFNPLLSLEAGYYDLPNFASYAVSSLNPNVADWYHANSDFLYGAGKLSLPFFIDRLTVFGKLGVAFHHIKRIAFTTSKEERNFSSPFVSVGLQYYLGDSFNVGLQYINTPGGYDRVFHDPDPTIGHVDTPNAYLILLNVGYRFNI